MKPDADIGGDTAPVDAVFAELSAVLARLGRLAVDEGCCDDAGRIDRIAMLEKVKAAAGAAQAAEMVRFSVSQVQAQQTAEVDPRALGRGIADQIALACRVSPSEGSRRLSIARVLRFEMPAVADLYRGGDISEYVTGLVVSETRHLTPDLRATVDQQLAAADLPTLSPRRAAALARRLGYEADRHRHGGPTSMTNGRGVCARGNHTREMPGWSAEVVHDGQRGSPHTVRVTTPTGHTYTSQAPRPP